MIFFVKTILTALLALILTSFLPWYAGPLAAFLVGLMLGSLSRFNFLSGMFGVSLAWAFLYVLKNIRNDGILLSRMAEVLSENLTIGLSGFLIILIALIIAGLTGGMAALTGSLLQSLLERKRKSRSGSYKINLQ